MKKIFIVLLMTLMLFGCSNDYERDFSEGFMQEIMIDELETKMNNNDTFVFLVKQYGCKGCIEFKNEMELYLPNHHVEIYYVDLSNEDNGERSDVLDTIRKYFPSMDYTPALYYVENGKEVDELESGEEGLTKEKMEAWVVRYQIDKKGE